MQHQRHRQLDAGDLRQRMLDLAQLHPEAAQLDLATYVDICTPPTQAEGIQSMRCKLDSRSNVNGHRRGSVPGHPGGP